MNGLNKILIASACIATMCSSNVLAQHTGGVSMPDNVADAVAVPAFSSWSTINEADITEKKRVWRTIDRQDNAGAFALQAESQNLIEVLLTGIADGKLKAYSAQNDRFTDELSNDALMKMMDEKMFVTLNTGKSEGRNVKRAHISVAVQKYLVKEDLLTLKGQSAQVVRIVGIAPVVTVAGTDGSSTEETLFWVYYPECREYLSKAGNAVAGGNWNQYFEGRNFKSTVTRIVETKRKD
jgi:hypothetical protein